jgi:hypothetical protein
MSDLTKRKKFHSMKPVHDSPCVSTSSTHGARKGFVSAPSPSDLKPTEREAFLLETLWKWHEASAKSAIILGQPLSC